MKTQQVTNSQDGELERSLDNLKICAYSLLVELGAPDSRGKRLANAESRESMEILPPELLALC